MQKLELNQFADIQPGYVIVDTRLPGAFAEGFIESSVSIPLDENFLSSLEDLVESDQKILLISGEEQIPELLKIVRSSALTNVAGYLNGGFETWKNAGNKTDILITIDADEFAIDYKFDEFYLVDVRAKEDFEKEHVEDAEHIALIDLEPILVEMELDLSYYVYGKTMAEGVTAASLFRRNGFHRVRAIASDYEALKASGVPFFVQKKKGSAPTNFPNN